jgi:hypothetical protein
MISGCIGSKKAPKNDCMESVLADSAFFNVLEYLGKYEIALSIQKQFEADKTLIFYFRNRGSKLMGAAALLVLDSTKQLEASYLFQSCCDSSVFESKIIPPKKMIYQFKQIEYNVNFNAEKSFFQCLKSDTHQFFEVLFVMRDGKIESGILIEGYNQINDFALPHNFLLKVKKVLSD